jgi:uncharacterized protein (TIGR04255 family)
MARDFLYKNAPLVEVIAEIHWVLQPLLLLPNAAVDPHLSVLTNQFQERAKAGGFGRAERLVPEQMPAEMFPHKPLMRFRPTDKDWPILQLGPGLAAVNMIPPYDGWQAFGPLVRQGADLLYASYPMPDKYLKLERLELRYVDGFTKELGFSNYMEFVARSLRLDLRLPEALAPMSPTPESATVMAEIHLPLKAPDQSAAVLKVGRGKINNNDGLVMEIACRSENVGSIQNPADVNAWMNSAHGAVREIFDRLTSNELKERMGPKTEIGAAQ